MPKRPPSLQSGTSNPDRLEPKLLRAVEANNVPEVKDVIENIIRTVWRDVDNVGLPEQFDVMTYVDAMSRVSLVQALMIELVLMLGTVWVR